jgi:hypothetical protein
MSKYFSDYVWKDGIPYGIAPLDDVSISHSKSYRILMDPYRKRIAVEKYESGDFHSVIYDSAFFNFRHLKPAEQVAWSKTIIKETADQVVSMIRNQDDRIIVIETYRFQDHLCRECSSTSPHGIPISMQKMFYTKLHDPFNGVILSDNNNHPVMFKRYAHDEDTGEFTELIEEQWNMQTAKIPDSITCQK